MFESATAHSTPVYNNVRYCITYKVVSLKVSKPLKSLTPAQRNERDAKALAEKKAKKAAQKAAAEGAKK